jgi:hypothetical protein
MVSGLLDTADQTFPTLKPIDCIDFNTDRATRPLITAEVQRRACQSSLREKEDSPLLMSQNRETLGNTLSKSQLCNLRSWVQPIFRSLSTQIEDVRQLLLLVRQLSSFHHDSLV